jgi:hypothetical protein
MPKTSHSQTRVAHRGPRHTSDPDRRVKYTLRFRRKGEELEPQTTLVRRHRRSEDRELSPTARRLFDRQARRRARQQAREELEDQRQVFNTTGVVGADAFDDEATALLDGARAVS